MPAKGQEGVYMALRTRTVTQHFQGSLLADDYLGRVEMELAKLGFTYETAIACLNLCRDEITHPVKQKIMNIFGETFNINGLGGCLTCGVTGIGAGLSHAPKPEGSTREKYIFFSFPHVAVNAAGEVGEVSRESRPHSHACGALLAVLAHVKKAGVKTTTVEEHDAMDPEVSILKSRMENHIASKGVNPQSLDLTSITKLAEEAITSDLEKIIAKAVDPAKADYAVFTGIQIHNWSDKFEDDEPNFEFIMPSKSYVVIQGKKKEIDISSIAAPSPRMMKILSNL